MMEFGEMPVGGEKTKRFPMLTPAMFQILLSLADREKHGYAIMKDVHHQTSNEMHLSAGTLYAALARLLKKGLIKESPPRPESLHDDARRHYYYLTSLGRNTVAAEAGRMQKAITQARLKGFRF